MRPPLGAPLRRGRPARTARTLLAPAPRGQPHPRSRRRARRDLPPRPALRTGPHRRSAAFAAAVAAIGARQKFIKPHCPWQNGKVERFNRTLQTEWAYRQAYTSNTERAEALQPWMDYYNTQRRHSALDGLPPISRLSPTS